jgi:plastocyanin
MAPSKYIGSFAVLAGAALAVAGCGGGSSSGQSSASSAGTSAASAPAPAAVVAPAPMTATMLVKSDSEKGKLGPDKQWHDAFLPADITVHPGQTVTVTVWNYDDKHSFNAPELGINQVLKGGTLKSPAKTVFTFKAPAKTGSYDWYCALPCDPWAMAHDGFMRGYVKVVA